MQERHSWEIENMKKNDEKQDAQLSDLSNRVRALESFKDSTVEKLITIFNMLEEIREGDKWIRRILASSLITAIIGAVVTAITMLLKG